MTLDSEGLHSDRPGAITTWSGVRVDPLDFRREDFRILDVAHSLALQCRYNGHCAGHYSVARHSLYVALQLETYGREMALYGLLHDAAEAYLGDVPRPLKRAPEMAFYGEAEARIDEVIAELHGLPWPTPPEVHAADNHVLLEMELNGARLRDTWHGDNVTDESAFLAAYARYSL